MTTKNTPVKKDWFVLGSITGAFAAVAKTLVGRTLEQRGVQVFNHADIAANVLLGRRRNQQVNLQHSASYTDHVLGWIGDAVLGSLFGTALSYLYARTQPGHEVAKGSIGSAWIWASSLIVGNLIGWYPLTRLSSRKMLNTLGVTVLFGAMQGWVMGRFAAKMPLQSHPVLVKEVWGEEYDENRLRSLDNAHHSNHTNSHA